MVNILASSFYYVNEPVIDMREAPTQQSKVVSQGLFSEKVTVNQTDLDWSHISTPDGYSGWVLSNTLSSPTTFYEPDISTSRLKTHLYGIKSVFWGPVKSVPFSSRLKVIDHEDTRWIKVALPDGKECYVQKGDVAKEDELKQKGELCEFSLKFLGLPYTWGGRSSFGYDCSGFVQMLYSQIGINLSRDARQQILDERFRSIEMDELEPGDLIFWGQSDQSIIHVGLFIGNQQFIHTSVRENMPWIRISSLSDFDWNGKTEAFCSYRTARQLIVK